MKRRTAVVLIMIFGLLGLQLPALAGDTVGLVDPTSGQWHLKDGGVTQSFYYGDPGDIPFMGDWDCDGVATPGLFRQSDAFAYLRNSNSQGNADIRFFFGNPSDIPLAGDFNGDGCDTLSIYRPSEARFYIVNKLGTNNGGLGPADYSFVFGNPGDNPFAGDFDGDGITEVGLHREATGFVYYRNTLTTGNADNSFFFGDPGDRFVAGDWSDADIVALAAGLPDTPAIFRPGDATFYFRDSNSQGNATAVLPFGEPSFVPVAGNTGSDPLQLGHPPRSPSPSTPTSFECLNPIGLNTFCGGDTDPAGQGDEAWVCLFFGTDVWDCEGNTDTTDVADEMWGCTLAASATDWNCNGDIDKRRPGTEAWSCSIILGIGWGCSGNIDGRSETPESWACTVSAVSPLSWTCAGDVDRSTPTQEKWDCADTNGIDWTCDGSHAWNAPMVASINGFISVASQASATALSEGPSVADMLTAAAFDASVP